MITLKPYNAKLVYALFRGRYMGGETSSKIGGAVQQRLGLLIVSVYSACWNKINTRYYVIRERRRKRQSTVFIYRSSERFRYKNRNYTSANSRWIFPVAAKTTSTRIRQTTEKKTDFQEARQANMNTATNWNYCVAVDHVLPRQVRSRSVLLAITVFRQFTFTFFVLSSSGCVSTWP